MDAITTFVSEPQNQLMLAILVSFIAQATGRAIPNDATGVKGFIRRVAKMIGLYADNKVTRGISVADVATDIVKGQVARAANGRFVSRKRSAESSE